MKKSLLILLLSLGIGTASFGQISDIGNFFAGGVDDAEELMKGYLGPYFDAFGTSLTGGWYNTAEPHKLGGFDVTATFNTAIVPSIHRNFDVSKLGLTNLVVDPNGADVSPTIAGEKNSSTTLNYNLLTNPKAFDMPGGTNFPYIGTPMLQLGLGLIKDTEIDGRYMPTFSRGDSKLGMWGIGFKHGLKQWIPFVKRIPVLHLSLQYGYTQLDGSVGFSVTPGDINAVDNAPSANWDDQRLEWITKSHTGNLIVSANLPVVCFYGGIGIASTKTELGVMGDIPVVDTDPALIPNITVTDNSYVSDLTYEFTNTDGSKTKPRYNVGMRLKFAVVTLHADYTYATYSMVSVGLGISFR
jgi:hypothetical protein